MTDELKPCPLCSNKPNYIEKVNPYGVHKIECSQCGLLLTDDNKEMLFISWNTRSVPEDTRLEKAMKLLREFAEEPFCACVHPEHLCWCCKARELLKEIGVE